MAMPCAACGGKNTTTISSRLISLTLFRRYNVCKDDECLHTWVSYESFDHSVAPSQVSEAVANDPQLLYSGRAAGVGNVANTHAQK